MYKKNSKNTKKVKDETFIPSLSGDDQSLEETRKKVFDRINQRELDKHLEKYLKETEGEEEISKRDINILYNMISEYMDEFMLFGYNLDGERILIQNFSNPKGKDAMMEFLKNMFFKYRNDE